jgi:hypothetical protein
MHVESSLARVSANDDLDEQVSKAMKLLVLVLGKGRQTGLTLSCFLEAYADQRNCLRQRSTRQ